MSMKKTLLLLLSSVLIFGYCNKAEAGNVSVEISGANFPDEIFRTYIAETADVDGDGCLDQEEIEAVREIDVSAKRVQNLNGVEIFTGLESLNCSNTNISRLDVGAFPKLETLDCHFTGLTELDVSANAGLKNLICYGIRITELNVSGNPCLEILDCSDSQINELDISRNQQLRILRCDDTKLKELDVTQNRYMESLGLVNTEVEELDAGGCPELKKLNCSGTMITQLDVEKNDKLEELYCMTDALIILHIGNNPELKVYTEQEVRADVEAGGETFDLASVYPLIRGKRISDIRGAELEGTSITGYSDMTEVSFSYLCGTSEAGELKRTIVLGISVPETKPGSGTPFTDVYEWQWYADTVRKAYERGIMGGVTESLFAPEEPMTRAMAVTVFYRMDGEPLYDGRKIFADVSPDSWYAPAAEWAYDSGIISGYADGMFGPDDYVTREQLAAMLWRYAAYRGEDVAAEVSLSQYTDYQDISEYAMKPVQWAVDKGIIRGNADGGLKPLDTASRAECAAMILRFDDK